jgi:hypothetical protein
MATTNYVINISPFYFGNNFGPLSPGLPDWPSLMTGNWPGSFSMSLLNGLPLWVDIGLAHNIWASLIGLPWLDIGLAYSVYEPSDWHSLLTGILPNFHISLNNLEIVANKTNSATDLVEFLAIVYPSTDTSGKFLADIYAIYSVASLINQWIVVN